MYPFFQEHKACTFDTLHSFYFPFYLSVCMKHPQSLLAELTCLVSRRLLSSRYVIAALHGLARFPSLERQKGTVKSMERELWM